MSDAYLAHAVFAKKGPSFLCFFFELVNIKSILLKFNENFQLPTLNAIKTMKI